MTTHWAIDLGTSNTTICEDRSGEPHVINLPELAKLEPITQTPVVPTALCITDGDARSVLIGQAAVTYNWDGRAAGYVRGFKSQLGSRGQETVARVDGRVYTAHHAAELYLRELVAALERTFGEDVTDLTFATPSGFYETYRAELQRIAGRLKRPSWWRRALARLLRRDPTIRFRTIDEPVAAALGYGVDLRRPSTLVAFDFGGGSMEAAVLRTVGPEAAETGRAEVLAKQAVPIGGNDVDLWILEALVPTALHDWPEWDVALRWEAERVKLLASAGGEGAFTFRSETFGTLDHPRLRGILAESGLYARIHELLDAMLAEPGQQHGIGPESIDDVILEGGSTLLPDVREAVGDVLGRDKIREWLPFEAVARGACIFAGDARVEDFIYHDYAVRVISDAGGDAEYELLIPGGTRYPTHDDFVTRYYAAGFDGQDRINLYISEIGRVAGQRVNWHPGPAGNLHYAPSSAGDRAFCVCLNEADAALPLVPPGKGSAPRLRATYCVDANRWLCATVHDLRRKVDLCVKRPVVRLR